MFYKIIEGRIYMFGFSCIMFSVDRIDRYLIGCIE